LGSAAGQAAKYQAQGFTNARVLKQKANDEIAKGDADRAAGKFEEAVGHCKNAWDLAT
jgi:hypothetical protein